MEQIFNLKYILIYWIYCIFQNLVIEYDNHQIIDTDIYIYIGIYNLMVNIFWDKILKYTIYSI